MNSGINKVVVVGRDADAWITALLLKQALLSLSYPVDVHLVELNSDIVPHDFYSVLPGHQFLHKTLAAKEAVLLAKSNGMYSFGQRYSNWSGSKPPFIQAYDRFGVDFKGVEFWHYWLKATEQGLKVPLENFSLGAVAAKAGRYAARINLTGDFSEASYGYNLSAGEYIQQIAKMAIKLGVVHSFGPLQSAEIEGQEVKSISLKNGQQIEADFFIDASGSEATLIRYLEKNNQESWSDFFSCDQLIISSTKLLSPSPAFTQISAFNHGWAGFFPLMNRTGVAIEYSSRFATPDETLERVSAMSGFKLEAPVLTSLSLGARKKHWLGNCLALGNAAVSIDTLDAANLHFLQIGLSLFRSLFPKAKNCSEEAKIYNEKLSKHVNGVRDYQLAHYYLNKRYGEPFWDAQRSIQLPESLRYRLELFQQRGMIAVYEEDVFHGADWAGLFIGHGVVPKNYNPLVDQIPDTELIVKFQQLLDHINKEVITLPTLESQIEINLSHLVN